MTIRKIVRAIGKNASDVLTTDELAAVQGANAPSASNVFATIAENFIDYANTASKIVTTSPYSLTVENHANYVLAHTSSSVREVDLDFTNLSQYDVFSITCGGAAFTGGGYITVNLDDTVSPNTLEIRNGNCFVFLFVGSGVIWPIASFHSSDISDALNGANSPTSTNSFVTQDGEIRAYTETLYELDVTGATATINRANGGVQYATMTNPCEITLFTPFAYTSQQERVTLWVKHDGTNTPTFVAPTGWTLEWDGGEIPTPANAVGDWNIYEFIASPFEQVIIGFLGPRKA